MRTNHLLVNILTITLPLTNEILKLVFSSISKEHSKIFFLKLFIKIHNIDVSFLI